MRTSGRTSAKEKNATLVEAIKAHQPKQPIVTCIRGTNEEEAFAILRDAGLEPLTNTEEAVQRAVDIAAGRA